MSLLGLLKKAGELLLVCVCTFINPCMPHLESFYPKELIGNVDPAMLNQGKQRYECMYVCMHYIYSVPHLQDTAEIPEASRIS